MVVIGLTSWPTVARLTRAGFLKTKSLEYVVAAQALGASDARTILLHVLPNTLAPIFVTATFGVASSILSNARTLLPNGWLLTLFPGMAIFLTMTSYNLIGEGLRGAADPRLKG